MELATALVIFAVLVAATFAWGLLSPRARRQRPTRRSRDDIRGRREERDLL
jgi:hypothetical protein